VSLLLREASPARLPEPPAQLWAAPAPEPRVSVADLPSFARLLILHLAPGLIFTTSILLTEPVLRSARIDPSLALFGGIGLVLVPLELGYLAVYARRTTGSWSPLRAVDYRHPVPGRRLALLGGGLAGWFLLVLLVSMAVLDQWLAIHAFWWMPRALLQFAVVQQEQAASTGLVPLAVLLVVAFACNGVAGPITEELYFRGHLLPRLEQRCGSWAPLINTALFALYHFFSPWRYPAILVGFLPITWIAYRERSVLVSMAAHMTINTVTLLLIVLAAFAGG
jgi:uncharacterized protein